MLNFAILAQSAAVYPADLEHVEPAVGGVFNATVWVSLAMLALVAVMVWKKVPAMVAAALDGKIAQIRLQLDEAAALRAEAEALRGEYQTKLLALEGETQALRDRAKAEADALIATAKTDAIALVARRQQMAEDRIAAAELTAIADVRATAARLAVAAAGTLIANGHDAASDAPLVDRAIADIAGI